MGYKDTDMHERTRMRLCIAKSAREKGVQDYRIAQDDVRMWWLGDLLLSCRQKSHMSLSK